MLEIFIFLQKQVNPERKTQHGVITNTSNGIKIQWCLLVQCLAPLRLLQPVIAEARRRKSGWKTDFTTIEYNVFPVYIGTFNPRLIKLFCNRSYQRDWTWKGNDPDTTVWLGVSSFHIYQNKYQHLKYDVTVTAHRRALNSRFSVK